MKIKSLIDKIKIAQMNCLHKKCPNCKGTGQKSNGDRCIHYISCPCQICRKYSL